VDWSVPEPPDDQYEGRQVLQSCVITADIQVKDNPFVKVSPTTKQCKVLENTDTKVYIKSLAKVKDVPYCDAFSVEEDLLVLSPSPTANCCVMRVAYFIIWHKSTIFKSKIVSSTLKAGHQFWADY
jgi:hypothetical protein